MRRTHAVLPLSILLLSVALAVEPALAGSPAAACRAACGAGAASAPGACLATCVRAVEACRLEGRRTGGPAACEAVRVARAVPGFPELPDLPVGRPADLGLLELEERAVVADADARAPALRTRPVLLHVAQPGLEVRVEQTQHGFAFGFPFELPKLRDPEDLAFFTRITRDHFSVAVLESNAKWARVAPEPDVRDYTIADAEVAWAEANGFRVKGHTLMWGIVPPFATSGVPPWVLSRFRQAPFTALDQALLRQEIRDHVVELVARYRGRIPIWDATNETLQPVAQFFVDRLGPEIVEDVFRWAHETDPEATLVFNEWIIEVFTGFFPFPDAAQVRDRVLELRRRGVPVHALGQQAHFSPSLAFGGFDVDLSVRTRIDDYAVALDTLAQAGLPIHLTETNFIAPDEPEARAAQAEALMRLWWGHPSVEQIVFWGPWNQVAGRDEFDVGLWDDAGELSRHGEAVLSLLNDRWRTRATRVADPHGRIALRAHHGRYVAVWETRQGTVHATFEVAPGAGPLRVVLAAP